MLKLNSNQEYGRCGLLKSNTNYEYGRCGAPRYTAKAALWDRNTRRSNSELYRAIQGHISDVPLQ